MDSPNGKRIVITGAAGLVGQNLAAHLEPERNRLIAIDKDGDALARLKQRFPAIETIAADLAQDEEWQTALAECDALIVGHAQIGGTRPELFVRNNIIATQKLIAAAKANRARYIVNISSSVVNSLARDDYTETKKAQEALVAASGIPQIVLRPTLMFGPFDNKHLGWLARFMRRTPLFPVPGNGRYLRQPLFVGDFCAIVASAIRTRRTGTFNISGQQRIHFIDLVRALRSATRSRTPIVRIPYSSFRALLALYARISSKPPFTVKQLEALVTPDDFEVIDWPALFGVAATPLDEALDRTFARLS